MLAVIIHVIPLAALLGQTEQNAYPAVQLHARIEQLLHRVNAHHSGSLIVGYTAAVDALLAVNRRPRQPEARILPSGALRNDVKVRENADDLVPLADLGVTHQPAADLLRAETEAVAQPQHIIKRVAAPVAERRALLVRIHRDALYREQPGERIIKLIFHDDLPFIYQKWFFSHIILTKTGNYRR